jgi:hypothetical protein
MDPPLADVVSFAEKAISRGERSLSGSDEGAPGGDDADSAAGDDVSVEAVDLARQAMFRRFGQLARRGPAVGAMRSVDDELAVLVYDSATAPEASAAVRGGAQPGGTRQLTFQGPELLIEVELDGPAREMTCQVVPPQPASLEVRHQGGTIELGVDDFGTFHVAELPGSTISLRCRPLRSGAEPTATSWITV